MTCAAHQKSGPCACTQPQFPTVVCNPPDLPAIDYRAGDYLSFRDKLLRPAPGETQTSSPISAGSRPASRASLRSFSNAASAASSAG